MRTSPDSCCRPPRSRGSIAFSTLPSSSLGKHWAPAPKRAQLNAFPPSVGPLLLENTRDAGCARVLSTHQQMLGWKLAYPSVDRASLVVVNRSAHQARFRNAATLYFAWLIGDRAPAWINVVYAEDIFPAGYTAAGTTNRLL